MRMNCPICGTRDAREFSYLGHANLRNRPDPDAGDVVWDEYLHNRDNIAGVVEDLWSHDYGCSAWLVVTRNTQNHGIISTRLAKEDAS